VNDSARSKTFYVIVLLAACIRGRPCKEVVDEGLSSMRLKKEKYSSLL